MEIGQLCGIIFAEFHPVQGPKITHQCPEGLLSADSFDGISEFIITKPQLCGRLVTINTDEYQIVGFPVVIEDKKYPRNALLFNLAFVLNLETNTKAFEPVVRKLANILINLELESEFIFKKNRLQEIIDQLLRDLNSYRESQIVIDNANSINLKIFPIFDDPPPIEDYHVPIPLVDLNAMNRTDWDLTMRKMIPLINGKNFVKQIADISVVDISLVRMCLQHLYYYGCVKLIDILQFENIYALTPDIRRLYNDTALQAECIAFVTKKDCDAEPFDKIFRLYCSLSHGYTLQSFYNNKFNGSKIDLRRFIIFGLIKGFLRRVHKYPVKTGNANAQELPRQIKRRMLTGQTHYDEICTTLGMAASEVNAFLKLDPNIKFIYS